MNLLIFAPLAAADVLDFINALLELIPDLPRELFYSLDELTERLRSPIYDDAIALFVISDRQSLSDLLAIRTLLRNIRILLVLRDQDEACISAGHHLYPRYLTTLTDDVQEIALVLNKMTRRQLLERVH